MSNYPAGFNGLEGQEIQEHLFTLFGEIEIEGEGLTRDQALDEILDMTVKELVEQGLVIE